MRRFVLTLTFVLTLATGLAGAESLGLEAAVARALEVNVTYQNALLAVDQAAADRSDLVNWKGIAVSATQKQTSATEEKAASTTTSLGLSLPLFDQLSATASVDQDQNTTVALSASPLAHSDTADQALIAWQKALLAADQARTTLEAGVRKAWLAQASAQAQLDLQVRRVALMETAYGDQKALYAKSQVTLAEVRTALKDWTDARTDQSDLERTLVKAKATLAGYLQAEAELIPLGVAELEALVAGLGPVDTEVKGTSTTVRLEALAVESARAKAEATWSFDPDLSVAASATVPHTGDTTWSASVTFSVALGDWQNAEKALANRAVTLAEASLQAQRTASRSTEAQALLAIESAAAAVESRQLALAQARELLQETRILAQAGEATALELEDAELGVTEAENALFAAWADAYGARIDLSTARS